MNITKNSATHDELLAKHDKLQLEFKYRYHFYGYHLMNLTQRASLTLYNITFNNI